ncbi:MAG: hypothetical protein IJ194_07750 [Bacilli bacterium]|nr:hypothetical protein [Bacilli bacterium]
MSYVKVIKKLLRGKKVLLKGEWKDLKVNPSTEELCRTLEILPASPTKKKSLEEGLEKKVYSLTNWVSLNFNNLNNYFACKPGLFFYLSPVAFKRILKGVLDTH